MRADDPDDARLLERPHPVQRRGGRQAGQPGELHVGAVRVGLQRGKQLDVNIIKFYGHITKLYSVDLTYRQIMAGVAARWEA